MKVSKTLTACAKSQTHPPLIPVPTLVLLCFCALGLVSTTYGQ
jgi:hypothetical protein